MGIGIEARWGRCTDVADMGCIVVIGRYAVRIVRDVGVAESALFQLLEYRFGIVAEIDAEMIDEVE